MPNDADDSPDGKGDPASRLEKRRQLRAERVTRRKQDVPDRSGARSLRDKPQPGERGAPSAGRDKPRRTRAYGDDGPRGHADERRGSDGRGSDERRGFDERGGSTGRERDGERSRRPKVRGPEPEIIPVDFPPESIDASAEKVVQRLCRAGHEAYLVGGCVRDLLVGHRPKDFDVATSARPEEVRALFRNSRIIGRRFRLVHVLFPGGHVIETATFRKNPSPDEPVDPEDLLIRSDNVFGQAHEDAYRRDFTINGLFYDLDRRAVLDWVGGMAHIRGRVVETIGDPMVRFREDPVRMLRAIKFAARIDFGMSHEVYEAAVQCRGTLAMAARPRLSEEVLRLMRGGACHRSIWLLFEMGMLEVLLPELSVFLFDSKSDEDVWSLLGEIDRRTQEAGAPLDDVILWTSLLLEPLLEACEGSQDRLSASQDFMEPIIERLNLPRRISDSVSRIVAMLPKLIAGKAQRFKKSALYPIAEQILALREGAGSPVQAAELPAKKRTRRPKRSSK